MPPAGRLSAAVAAALLFPKTTLAEDPMLLIDQDGFMLRAHLQVGLNAVAEQSLFWNYADTFAPDTNFDSDTDWLEGYLMPGLSFSQAVGADLAIYGKISVVASGTVGIDAFDVGNTGRITLEEGYLGIRSEADGGDPASFPTAGLDGMIGKKSTDLDRRLHQCGRQLLRSAPRSRLPPCRCRSLAMHRER